MDEVTPPQVGTEHHSFTTLFILYFANTINLNHMDAAVITGLRYLDHRLMGQTTSANTARLGYGCSISSQKRYA